MTNKDINSDRLRQVLGAFYKTVDVMKSARNKPGPMMCIWTDDMKAVEDVVFFLEQLRDAAPASGNVRAAAEQARAILSGPHYQGGQSLATIGEVYRILDAALSQAPEDAMSKGYRGFESKKAYEDHYSDPKNYADEIPAMEAYTRESADEEGTAITITRLDPLADLVNRFSKRLLAKLRLAQANGRSGWDRDDWEKECQQGLLKHIAKGDPRDVAAYCAFMDHHGWITVPASGDVRAAVIEALTGFVEQWDRLPMWNRDKAEAAVKKGRDVLAALSQAPATDAATKRGK